MENPSQDVVTAMFLLDQKLAAQQLLLEEEANAQRRAVSVSRVCKRKPRDILSLAARMRSGRPGSRRHTRWLNRRLLEANLRRILYESGEDIMESCLSPGNQMAIRCGKKGMVGIGIKDIPMRKFPTYWTRLREDLESSQLFRRRKDDDILHYHDKEIFTSESEGADDGDDSEGMLQTTEQTMLELKIFNTFRRSKKTMVNRAPFLVDYLEAVERVFFTYLTEWREKVASSSSVPMSLERNVFKLENNCLDLVEHQEQNQMERNLVQQFPDALLFWNLSGIHRKMTYLLCSVWNLAFHSRIVNSLAVGDVPLKHRQGANDKVVVIQVRLTTTQIPVFPVAMNLVNILSSPSKKR